VQLFFIDSKLVRRHLESSVVSGEEIARLLDDRALLDGMPVFLDEETMMPIEPLCSWGRSLSNSELGEGTMKDYGRIIARVADYQAERGRDVVTAAESDLLAY